MSAALSEHWPTKRLRYLTFRRSSDNRRTRLADVSEASFLPMEAIGEQGQLDLSAIRPVDEVQSGYSQFCDGDVVIAKITPCFENGKGAHIRGTLGGVGFGTTELHVLTPGPDLDRRFLYYITVDPSFRQHGAASMTGAAGQQRVPEDFVREIRVRVPPLSQQRTIADYLDRETARLDALLAAKERVIELLAEKRRALITRAVTRGLDTRVPLRDSGIPWLGKTPAHWEVTRLKFVARIRTGLALGKRFGNKLVREYPYLRVANVQDGHLDLSDVKSICVPDDEALLYHLRAGDVLMNEGGDANKLGRGAIWTGQISPCLHQNHVFAVRPRRLSPAWLNSWISSDVAKAYFESRAKQSTNLASISTSNLNEMPLLKPPDREQRSIVDYVTRYTARIDNFRKATERTTALLKERRAALIAAAVTGRINVDYTA